MKLLIAGLIVLNSVALGFERMPTAGEITQINVGYHVHFTGYQFVALRDKLIRVQRYQGPGTENYFKSSPEVLEKLAAEILKTSLFDANVAREAIHENVQGVFRITLTDLGGRQVVRSFRFEDKDKFPDVKKWMDEFGKKDPLAAAEIKAP